MSDTPANQKHYPQHSNQKVGCGFPLAKLVVWFCVTTGAVLEVRVVAFTTSEWELARQLYAKLQPDDVIVADSAYGTYVDLALVGSMNADALRVRQSPTEGDPPSGLDSPCFVNIMRVTVIFVGGRSWALAIIKSCGNVRLYALNL